jgi:hypothetical protein
MVTIFIKGKSNRDFISNDSIDWYSITVPNPVESLNADTPGEPGNMLWLELKGDRF